MCEVSLLPQLYVLDRNSLKPRLEYNITKGKCYGVAFALVSEAVFEQFSWHTFGVFCHGVDCAQPSFVNS